MLTLFLLLYVFWLLFVLCAGFYFAWPRLATAVKVLAAPAAIFAGVFDVVFNYTIACVMFMSFPPEGCITFTRRISAYKKESGLRAKVSRIICSHFLDPFQQGGHCS